ncbi:MAG TPA: type II toxin-antitoxin system RelE/ParE family toxin [Thermoanaerobaculia bacterium]
MKVTLSRDALRDRREAEAYYRQNSLSAVSRFRRDLSAAFRFIVEFPEGSPLAAQRTRKKRLLHFPYTIYYVVVAEQIFITAVASELRDPVRYADRIV